MTRREIIVAWAGRVCAVALALLALGVIIPNIGPKGWPGDHHVGVLRQGRDPWAVATYVAIACGLVTCIFIGQRRWRTLEVTGWALLLAFVILAFR